MRAPWHTLTAGAVLLLGVAVVSPAQTPAPVKPLLGDNSAGSRGQPAHIIPLRDPEGDTIQPDDRRPLPFSTKQTCGPCHDVDAISHGWHFNAASGGAAPGRTGQPWFLVDRDTATQIPLSYREWPGTYRPSQLGLSNRAMALRFGGRTAGGIPQDPAASKERARWSVSGDLEVNCLTCHDGSAAYDHAEYAKQVASENFRYAPAAASGLAAVTGSSKAMPDLFDYLLPASVEDGLQDKIPHVDYAKQRFLPNGKVAFDIVREVKNIRCYYCHTNIDAEQTGGARWKSNEDIHMARGMTCVQCHRNNLDHMMTRGYEGEAGGDAFTTTLSCRGCHLGEDNQAGRMGAPHPDHAGIPPLHFEKLTCTACHSGPWPSDETRRLKNGLSHGLGEFNVNKSKDALPHISYPVFATQENGKIGANRMVWPAFWGRLKAGSVAPLGPDEVRKALEKGKLLKPATADGSWPQLDSEWVLQVLHQLDAESGAAPAVYIAGGKLHRLDGGKLVTEDHAQARPHLWPMAHDVRPASQALGVKGCQDSHAEGAAFFDGKVAVDSPLASDRLSIWKMARFEKNMNVESDRRLARYWVYRPWLKGGAILAACLMLLVLAAYSMKGVERVAAGAAGYRLVAAPEGMTGHERRWSVPLVLRWTRVAVNVAGVVMFTVIGITGFSAWMGSEEMTGDRLMWHMGAAPLFLAASVAVALFWAHRNGVGGESTVARLRKIFFWTAGALLVPTVVSILLAMFPLAGTDDQETLFELHRWCAAGFSVSAILFALCALWVWRQERPR